MGSSHTREAVGFMARWTLLAFVAATIAAVTWASARTTAAITAAVRARLVVKDWVLRPAIGGRRGFPLFGHVRPAPGGGSMSLALVCFPGRSIRLMKTMDERCPWRLTDPRQGRYDVVIRGLPYGPVAFQTREAIVSCIPRDRPVLLVDARLALQQLRSRPLRWRTCLRRMHAAGEVVLFHPGPMGEFTDCRDQLRQLHAGQPVVCPALFRACWPPRGRWDGGSTATAWPSSPPTPTWPDGRRSCDSPRI